jgi:hypothetical protein
VSNPEVGATSCAQCHPDLARQGHEQEPVSAEEAVHQKCLSCHNVHNKDLEDTMPAICSDCHRPSPSVLTGWGEGVVLWSHTRHRPEFNRGAWQCDTCHHKDLEGSPQLACSVCHGTGHFSRPAKEMPGLAKAYDKRCLGCHREHKAGPLRVKDLTVDRAPGLLETRVGEDTIFWDHRLHADSLAFSCRECHHNIRTQAGALVICPSAVSCPEEEGMGALQSCRNCHGERGPVPGSLADADEFQVPGLAEALKRPCLECHLKLGAGPRRWEEMVKARER